VAVAVGDSGDVGRWCQVSWMVVGRKRLLILDDAIQKQYLPRSVVSLLMVLWCSGKNATLFAHVMCPRVQCSILDVVTIFDYIYDGDSHGILAEFQQNSNGIPRTPMGIILGGSRILTISVGIPWKKVGISMELETKMAEAPANCFPLKFHGIPTFRSESTGTHGGG